MRAYRNAVKALYASGSDPTNDDADKINDVSSPAHHSPVENTRQCKSVYPGPQHHLFRQPHTRLEHVHTSTHPEAKMQKSFDVRIPMLR